MAGNDRDDLILPGFANTMVEGKTDYNGYFYYQDRVHCIRNGSIACRDERNYKREVFVESKVVYLCLNNYSSTAMQK